MKKSAINTTALFMSSIICVASAIESILLLLGVNINVRLQIICFFSCVYLSDVGEWARGNIISVIEYIWIVLIILVHFIIIVLFGIFCIWNYKRKHPIVRVLTIIVLIIDTLLWLLSFIYLPEIFLYTIAGIAFRISIIILLVLTRRKE